MTRPSPPTRPPASIRGFGNLAASTQQAPRIGSTLSLVAAGLGVTFVPASLQRMNLEGVVYPSHQADGAAEGGPQHRVEAG
jgi:hypothetical protein